MKTKIPKTLRQKFLILSLVAVTSLGFVGMPFVAADDYSSEIARLQQENEKNEQQVLKLEEQAVGYEDAIKKLAAQIDGLQAKIDENTKQQKRLEREIKQAEKELAIQKELLGQNIRTMYLDSGMTTLEMLASSKDISEFVDKEQYRNAVQSKIQLTLEKIQALRLKLRTQKEAVDMLLNDQVVKRAELDASRKKQHDMLAYNAAQRAAFNRKTEKNRERISELIAAQRAANFKPDGGYYFIRFPGPIKSFNADAYPHRNAGFSMQLGPCSFDDNYPDEPDGWGYCTRQCVSFAAWAVGASGRDIPRGYGDAKDWVATAYAYGIPVYRTPRPGDVAISTDGQWGHAMYVQSVSGDHFYSLEYNGYLDGRPSHQKRLWNY